MTDSRASVLVPVLTLTLCQLACARWQPMSLDPLQLPATEQVRATLRSGERVIVISPVIERDTLKSRSGRGVPWSGSGQGIPRAQIVALEVQKTDAAATVATVLVGGVALGAIIVFAVLKSLEASW